MPFALTYRKELMSLLIIMIVIAVVFAVIVYNFKKIRGRLRKPFLIVNAVLGAVLVIAVGMSVYSETVYSSASRKYNVSRGGLLGGIYYSETLDGYYIIHVDALFSSDYLAIPAEYVELPRITKVYSPVMIFRSKDSSDRGGDITINTSRYRLYDNVVKIVPDYFELSILMFAVGAAAIPVFNVIAFAVTEVVEKKRRDSDEL